MRGVSTTLRNDLDDFVWKKLLPIVTTNILDEIQVHLDDAQWRIFDFPIRHAIREVLMGEG